MREASSCTGMMARMRPRCAEPTVVTPGMLPPCWRVDGPATCPSAPPACHRPETWNASRVARAVTRFGGVFVHARGGGPVPDARGRRLGTTGGPVRPCGGAGSLGLAVAANRGNEQPPLRGVLDTAPSAAASGPRSGGPRRCDLSTAAPQETAAPPIRDKARQGGASAAIVLIEDQ